MPSPDEPAGEDAARQQIAAARQEFERLLSLKKIALQQQATQARVRLAHATSESNLWEDRRAQVLPHAGHPVVKPHYEKVRLLAALYGAMKRMLALELEVYRHNLELAQAATPAGGAIPFRDPLEELAWVEQKLRMDAALAVFLWQNAEEGIDAALRASQAGVATPALEPAVEASRAARARELAETAARDPALQKLLHALGNELAAARPLVSWARGAFEGFEQLGPEARRRFFQDPSWNELDAVATLLAKLHARAAALPLLARLFPKPESVDLPFTRSSPVAPVLAAPTAAGQLELKKGGRPRSGCRVSSAAARLRGSRCRASAPC